MTETRVSHRTEVMVSDYHCAGVPVGAHATSAEANTREANTRLDAREWGLGLGRMVWQWRQQITRPGAVDGLYWHSRPSVPVPTTVSPSAQLSMQAPLLSTLELVQRKHTGPSVP